MTQEYNHTVVYWFNKKNLLFRKNIICKSKKQKGVSVKQMGNEKSNGDGSRLSLIKKRAKKIERMHFLIIDEYNKRLPGSFVNIYAEGEIQRRKCGWEIYIIDLEAVQDFLRIQRYIINEIGGDKLTIKEILTLALRYSIPQIFYDMALDKNNKLSEINIEKYKEVLNKYNEFVNKESCLVTDKYNHLTERYSWDIDKVDYDAATFFKRISKLTYKDILKNALRTYLSEVNYRHAKEMVSLMVKHMDEYLYGGNESGQNE